MLLVNNLIGFGARDSSGGIQFVGGNTAAKAGAASGNTTIALGSGLTGGIDSAVATDDLVIAVFGSASFGSDRTLAITDGTNNYTLIGSEQFEGGGGGHAINLRTAYKFMGVSPDASTTFGPTGNSTDAGAMAVYVFRGVNKTTPLDVTVKQSTIANSLLANPPSITPVTAGAFIVCVGGAAHGGGVDTFTSSDLVQFQTIGSDDFSDVTIGIGHKDDWTSGAFDAAAFGCTQTDSTLARSAATTLALRPA